MVNSTFKPNHRSQFQADWLKFDGKSAYAEAQPSEEKNSDLVLTDDVLDWQTNGNNQIEVIAWP